MSFPKLRFCHFLIFSVFLSGTFAISSEEEMLTEKESPSDKLYLNNFPSSREDSFEDLDDIKEILSEYDFAKSISSPENVKVFTDLGVLYIKIGERAKNNLYPTHFEYTYLKELLLDSLISSFDLLKTKLSELQCKKEGVFQTLPSQETDFRKIFFYYEDARNFAIRNVCYYSRNRDDSKRDLWEHRRRSLRKLDFPNRIPDKQTWNYCSQSRVKKLGISYLHDLDLYGEGVTIAILDVVVDYNMPSVHFQCFKRDLIEGSTTGLTDHSSRVLAVLGGDVRTIHDSPSIAPQCQILHFVTKKWGYSKNTRGNLDYQSNLRFVKNKLLESDTVEFLTDVILEDPVADKELEDFFDQLLKKGIKIVNVSRDLLLGSKSRLKVEKYIHQGGVLVISLGNGGFTYTQAGLIYEDTYSFKVAVCQLPFIRYIHENDELKKGVIFVAEVEEVEEKTGLTKMSCKPGSLICDRTLCSFSQYYVILNQISRTVGATSGAAAVVTGIMTLLQGAFPKVPPQTIAQVLLDQADSLGNYPTIQGQGVVNAERTYFSLRNVYACGKESIEG